MNLISFSLFGDAQRYKDGAIANAEIAKDIYPGWETIFYTNTDSITSKKLVQVGATVIPMPTPRGHEGTFWRFSVAHKPDATVVLFRDVDCLLNTREKAAVDAWLESDYAVHSMHEHDPEHIQPLQAGLLGLKSTIIPYFAQMARCYPYKDVLHHDQVFLQDIIYPEVKDKTLHHSSIKLEYECVPFPDVKLPNGGFVGQTEFY